MNTYISTILIILSLFVFSIIAYEWGNSVIEDGMVRANHAEYNNELKILKNTVDNAVLGGIGSKREFNEMEINPKKCNVVISNETNNISFEITCIEGINSLSYDMYFKNDVLYVFIYNFTTPYSKIDYVKYEGYRVYEFNGNLTVNYCGNIRYYYVNSSKIYLYNILTG